MATAFRIENVKELVTHLEEVAIEQEINFCGVSGFGRLTWVELACGDPEESERIEGPMVLVSLDGRIRRAGDVVMAEYVANVARQGDDGMELFSGVLLSAGVDHAEIAVTHYGEITQGQSGLKSFSGTEPGSVSVVNLGSKPARPSIPGASAWADAMDESSRVSNEVSSEKETTEARPNAGDVVHHRQFGRCQVAKVTDDHITLRKPDGRTVQLGLAVLQFIIDKDDDETREFSVQVKAHR